MEAKTRDRGRSSLTSGGVADTGKVLVLLGNEGDGEAARGPRKPSLVFDEAEGLPCGNGREGALAFQCTIQIEEDCILGNCTRLYT